MRTTRYLLVVLTLAIMMFISWLLLSQGAARWLIDYGISVSKLNIQIEALEGRLIGPLQLHGVLYQNDNVEVELEHVSLNWEPSKLLMNTIAFSELDVEEVRITRGIDDNKVTKPFVGFTSNMDILIKNAHVRNIAIHQAEQLLFQVNSWELSGKLKDSKLNLKHMVLHGPWGMFDTTGYLGTKEGAEVDLKMQWKLIGDDMPAAVTGSGNVIGTLDQLILQQTLNAPYTAQLNGELSWLTQAVKWSMSLNLSKIDPQAINSTLPKMSLSGLLNANGDLEKWHVAGDLDITQQDWGEWQAQIDGQGKPDHWHFSKIELQQADGISHIMSNIDLTLPADDSQQPLIAIEARWDSLHWPFKDEASITSRQGQLSWHGTLEQYQTTVDTELSLFGLPSSQWHLTGNGDKAEFKASELTVAWLDGDWTGHGELSWQNQFSWSAQLQGQDVNPAIGWKDWPGQLAAVLSSSGVVGDKQYTAMLGLDQINGRLRGRDFKGDTKFIFDNTGFTIESLNAMADGASLNASGRVAENMALSWAINATDLGDLLPEAKGSLNASGNITGQRSSPEIYSRAKGEGIHWQDHRIGTVDAEVRLGDEKQASSLHFNATDIAISGQELAKQIYLQGKGQRVTDGWQMTLADGQVTTAAGNVWQQKQSAQLMLIKPIAQLKDFCWMKDHAQICGQLHGQSLSDWATDINFAQLELKAAQQWLPKGIQLDGQVTGQLKAEQKEGGLESATLSLYSQGGKLSYPLIDSEPQTITYQSANTDFMYSAAGLEANILLQLSKGNHTKAELKLPDWQPSTDLTDDQKVSGRLDVALADLTLLPLFIPDIADPTGRLSVNIDLAGSYGKPLLQGDAHLDNGSCTLPRFGLTLQDISIVGQTKDQDTLQLQGSARSGKGKTQVKGKVVVTSLKDWQAELKLTGDHFEILNLPQAQILVSPDLNLVATPGELLVDGKITIPEAEVEYIRIPETVTISPDVIIVDQPDVTIEQRLNVFTQVQLILGDKIRVRGYGFESGLNGQLMLINDPPAPLSIWGDVNIEDGNYRAYGQDLTIEQGRLMFAGSALNNPGIDLRAARIKGDITAGIHATGRLTSPELTLYSQPPMDQADILAYIVIGQPLGQAKTEQGDVLYSAASSIGLAGGELLSKNIGKRFDIEEVRIETGTEVEEATLIIGTQVSSRLYVRYAYELWNNINTLLTRYKLDRHWYLETETGVESSADFKYTIEK